MYPKGDSEEFIKDERDGAYTNFPQEEPKEWKYMQPLRISAYIRRNPPGSSERRKNK